MIENCIFSNNLLSFIKNDHAGGALYIDSFETFIINNSKFYVITIISNVLINFPRIIP